jgi:ABC-type dipeptide/oligopeptide/nickel transport system ATPase component
MTLISIIGDVGSGKTLLATYLAAQDTRDVYANYKINIDRYHDLTPEILITLNYPSLSILDEAYTKIESRMSGRKLNEYMSYVLFQSRKRQMDIIITDQLVSSIDVRYRMLTNYEIFCEAVDDGFKYIIEKKSMYSTFKPSYFFMPFELAEKVYPLYDTFQKIEAVNEDMLFEITEDKTEIIKKIDLEVIKMLKIADAK